MEMRAPAAAAFLVVVSLALTQALDCNLYDSAKTQFMRTIVVCDGYGFEQSFGVSNGKHNSYPGLMQPVTSLVNSASNDAPFQCETHGNNGPSIVVYNLLKCTPSSELSWLQEFGCLDPNHIGKMASNEAYRLGIMLLSRFCSLAHLVIGMSVMKQVSKKSQYDAIMRVLTPSCPSLADYIKTNLLSVTVNDESDQLFGGAPCNGDQPQQTAITHLLAVQESITAKSGETCEESKQKIDQLRAAAPVAMAARQQGTLRSIAGRVGKRIRSLLPGSG